MHVNTGPLLWQYFQGAVVPRTRGRLRTLRAQPWVKLCGESSGERLVWEAAATLDPSGEEGSARTGESRLRQPSLTKLCGVLHALTQLLLLIRNHRSHIHILQSPNMKFHVFLYSLNIHPSTQPLRN
jgi:hypothetical protein